MGISAVISLVSLALYLVLIVLVLRRRPRPRANQVFVYYLVAMVYWQFNALMVSLSTSAEMATFWYQMMLTGAVFAVLYFHFTQVYLNLRTRRRRMILALGYAFAALLAMLSLAFPEYVLASVEQTASGLYVPELAPLMYVYGLFVYAYMGLGMVSLVGRFREAQASVEKNRLRGLIVGISVVFAGTLSNFTPLFQGYPIDIIANTTNAALIANAILRYELFDIPVALRRGLLYSVPTAVIGIGYFLVVYLALHLFDPVSGYQVFLISLLLAALTGVAVRPLWGRLPSWIDRLLFRETYTASVMLQRLSRTAASVLDLDQLANMILGEIWATMRISRLALLLKDGETGEFRFAAARGLGPGTVDSFRHDHPLVIWLSEQRNAVTRQQVDFRPRFKALWDEERRGLDQLGADLYVPLLVRQQLIGILALGPKQSKRPYSADDRRTLTTLANQTAVAVENARLFSLEQRRAAESTALLEIARAVSSTLELNKLLAVVTQRTAEVCGVDRCSILLLDPEKNRLVPLMSQFRSGAKDRRLWRQFVRAAYVEPVDAIPGLVAVLQGRKPVVLNEDSLPSLPAAWIEPFGVKNLLAVPLVSKDQVTGLMVLDHSREGQHFTDEQVDLATTIGIQATIAIENARLYAETIAQKNRTETILEQAFSGIMVVDPNMNIVTVNPEAEALTGFAKQELLGRRLPEILGPELWEEGSLLQRAMASHVRIAPAETTLMGKNGPRDILLGITPIQDSFVLNFADITHLKEVDRLKTNIVANVSHELRAPLASIKAYAELLLSDLDRDDRELRHRFVSIIDQETDWLTELINALLDLSHLESGQYVTHMELLSVKEVVTAVLALFDMQVRKKELAVCLDFPPDLPWIVADKELMTMLVKNLLGNAVKFSLAGGGIVVRAWVCGDDLLLEFEDHGIGIAQADMSHLFRKFFRTGLAKERGIRGTGLGLVLAKEAVDLHGGSISVESELGVGTRFRVALPIRQTGGVDLHLRGEFMHG